MLLWTLYGPTCETEYGSGAQKHLGQDAAEDGVRDKPSQDCEDAK